MAIRRRRRRGIKLRPVKKRLEFSKLLSVWAAVMATAAAAASFILSAFDKQPVSDLAIGVFSACIGYLITYAGKSAFEKNSRNIHGLDENGIPLDRDNGGDD